MKSSTAHFRYRYFANVQTKSLPEVGEDSSIHRDCASSFFEVILAPPSQNTDPAHAAAISQRNCKMTIKPAFRQVTVPRSLHHFVIRPQRDFLFSRVAQSERCCEKTSEKGSQGVASNSTVPRHIISTTQVSGLSCPFWHDPCLSKSNPYLF